MNLLIFVKDFYYSSYLLLTSYSIEDILEIAYPNIPVLIKDINIT